MPVAQKYLQKQLHSSRSAKNAIDQKKIAGRLSIVPAGQTFARWQQHIAGGLTPWPVECGDGPQAIPCPSKAKHKCLVQNQTQNSQVEGS